MTKATSPQTFGQGRYEIEEVLQRGYYSSIYKAYDIEADKLVALKVLTLVNDDRDIAEAMFSKEVDALRGFNHEGVVQLLDHFTDRKNESLCIVLELIPKAVNLEQLIRQVEKKEREPQGLSWCIEQMAQLISVLDQAHTRQVIHRDVKPANLLVGERRGQVFMKLADFGIARLLEHYGKDKGITLPQFATVPYAPPEQVRQRETTVASDYYAFGVTLTSLLTWKIPEQELEGEALEAFIKPLASVFEDSESNRQIVDLVRDLLSNDPQERPRPPTIRRVLDHLLNRLASKPRVGLKVTYAAKSKIESVGMNLPEFFEDLNDYTVAEYQENEYEGEKRQNIAFYGRTTFAFSTVDRDDPEKLVLVDAKVEQPNLHRKRRESNTVHVCPYEITDGNDSAYDLLNEFYEHYRRDLSSLQRYQRKEDLLEAGLFILDRLENEATELIISYRQREKQQHDDILTVEVLYAVSSEEGGLEVFEAADGEVIHDWISGLDSNTSFSLKYPGRKKTSRLGTLRNYNPYTRELSLLLGSQISVPPQGQLVCQNVAQLASNKRQRVAVDRFLSDETLNPRLGDLLLAPGKNSLGTRKPRELIQDLAPRTAIQDVIERALSAEDFFLIQGPPGTGKTTLIAELVLQILEEDPNARILLTAQANPAVDNAMERVRALASEKEIDIRTLRLTRSHKENEFEDSFAEWAAETQRASGDSLPAILKSLMPDAQKNVEEAIENWHEKLLWAEDVRRDYAQSVQVYGVTCLRAPTLWELLRRVEFDWVIVDEAAKATDTEVLVPLVHGKRFVLVGDQRQLPPYLDTEVERAMRFEGIDASEARTSLFEKVFDMLPQSNKTTLRRQYRMHRSIGDFVGRLFYNDIGGLETGVADEDRAIALKQISDLAHRVLWLDVPGGKEEREEDGTSYYNRSEAVRINKILELFNSELQAKGVQYSVGVITPYSAQVDVLTRGIIPAAKMWTNLNIEVSTVDAFQGRENDITVYSMVRTQPGSLRFVEDEKRLNVTFSRAKRALLLFGHKETALSSTTFARAIKLLPQGNVISGDARAS